MMKKLKKGCLFLFLLISMIWCLFWLYRQYELKDVDFNEVATTGRIIKIRDNLYSVSNFDQYSILLMSKDMGKTWQEKNVRGVWNVFPLFKFLQLDSPLVDVISIDSTLYIIEKQTYGDLDSLSGFYFAYKSTNEGESWLSCFSLSARGLAVDIFNDDKPNQYYYYDYNTQHFIQQEPSEIIKLAH